MIAVIALAFTLMVANGFVIAVVATGGRAGDPLTGVVSTVTGLIVSTIVIPIALHWKKEGFIGLQLEDPSQSVSKNMCKAGYSSRQGSKTPPNCQNTSR